MPLLDHTFNDPWPFFGLSKRVMFTVICLLSVEVVFSYSSDREVSIEVKKIGWKNPDEIVFDNTEVCTEVKKRGIGWINPDEMLDNEVVPEVKKRIDEWINPDEMLNDELDDWVNPFHKTGDSKFKKQGSEWIDPDEMLDYKAFQGFKKQSDKWINQDKIVYDDLDDWVNPFHKTDDSRPKSKEKHTLGPNEKEFNNMRDRLSMCNTYMQRFINLFLRYSGLKDYQLQSTDKEVNFELVITRKDLAVLQKFGRTGNGLPDVDTVLTKLFDKEKMFSEFHSSNRRSSPTREGSEFSWSLNFLRRYIDYLSSSSEMIIITMVFAAWFLTFWSTYISGSYRMPIFNLFIIIFVAGYAMTWLRMYQEAEAERYQSEMMNPEIPAYCRGGLPWYNQIYYAFFKGEDCSQYFKRKLVDPMVKVTPTIVLAETVSQMFLYPTKHIAQSYGDFISTSIGSVPWYLKPIIIPIAFVVPLILVFGIIILLLGSKINLNPFSGLTIFPNLGRKEEVLDKENRKYIEEVNVDNPKRAESDRVESALLKVNKPLFMMNWAAFKRVTAANKYVELDDLNSEVKSITSDCLSDTSEDTDVIIKKRENKEKEKKFQTSTPVESPTLSGGSGDSLGVSNRSSTKEPAESKKKNMHKYNIRYKIKVKSDTSDNNKSTSTADIESPSPSKYKSNVQQWLDEHHTP